MNIKTGMIAPQNVNVNEFHKIGTHIIQSMIDLAVQIPAKFISKTVQKCSMGKFTADPHSPASLPEITESNIK